MRGRRTSCDQSATYANLRERELLTISPRSVRICEDVNEYRNGGYPTRSVKVHPTGDGGVRYWRRRRVRRSVTRPSQRRVRRASPEEKHMSSMHRTSLLAIAALSALAPASPLRAQQAKSAAMLDSASVAAFHFRFVGPEGNRVTSVAGVTGDPMIVLRGRGVGRHLQDHRRRHPLGADLRQAAGLVDRRARRRAVGSERRLGRHRRAVHPQPHLGRLGRVQVHRRRRAGRGWASRPRAASRASSSIRAIPSACYVAALGHAYGPQPERGIYRTTRRRQDVGEGARSSTTPPAAWTS